jgi:nicotinate-nucleotide pyrophosphorylase (carboxylating)
LLEKAAVRAGGGVNHRGNLSDGILVKDNHLAGLSISDAVRRARLKWPGRGVEVECDTREQVDEAVGAGADMVLLDNMSLATLAECVRVVKGRAILEASGGVTLATVRAIAETGIDWISIGALTHSAPSMDLALDFE